MTTVNSWVYSNDMSTQDLWQIDPADPSVGIFGEDVYHECADGETTETSPGVYACTCGATLDRNRPADDY